MATIHTYGRDLTFHVHVHLLCTEGGLRADGVWQPVYLFPAQQYRRLWQYFLLTLLRRTRRGPPPPAHLAVSGSGNPPPPPTSIRLASLCVLRL